MRSIGILLLLLLLLAPNQLSAQRSRVLVAPLSTGPGIDDDFGSKTADGIRSGLKQLPTLVPIEDKEVRNELKRLQLKEEDLKLAQWPALGGRLKADYVIYGTFETGATGNECRVSIANLETGDDFLLTEATIQGDGKEEARQLAEMVVTDMKKQLSLRLAILFCSDYRSAGQYDDALRNCNEAVALAPNSYSALFERGLTYLDSRDCASAEADFISAASARANGMFFVGASLVKAQECLGKIEDAMESRLSTASPEDSASILVTLGRTEPEVVSEYDRFDDETLFATPWFLAKASGGLVYRVQVTCPGSEPCTPDAVWIIFASRGEDWSYLENRRLVILADQQRFDLGELEHHGDVEADRTTEIMGGMIPLADMEAISEATEVDARLGTAEFSLLAGARDGFRALLAIESEN